MSEISDESDRHRVENRRVGAAADWLSNEIVPVLRRVYGALAQALRIFFMATADMFGHADGTEWGVSHYRVRAA